MRGKRTLNIELIILSIKVDFCPREKLQPTQKIKNFNIKPENFFWNSHGIEPNFFHH